MIELDPFENTNSRCNMKESLILIGVLLIFFQHVQGACENRLGPYRNLTVYDTNGNVLETLTKCKDLVKNHPILCTRQYGQEEGDCCKSCRKKDTSCIDNSLIFWTVGDQSYGCAEYVQYDPCACEDTYTKGQCCKSCSKAVCKACRDYISESNYVDILDNEGNTIKRLTDCETLVNDYLYLCKRKYGQDGGHCCESCSKQDLACIDGNIFWIVGNEKQNCAEYVAGDPCRCEISNVAEKCCASCKGKEITNVSVSPIGYQSYGLGSYQTYCIWCNALCPACRDYLSESNYVDVLDSEGKIIERLTDCDTLVNDYLYLCEKEYGQEGGQCCESCSDQDLSCIDDGSVWGDDKKSCAEFVEEDPCRCEASQVSERCCASCEGKVCPACRDYISESNYVDILDNEGNTIKRLTDCDTLVNDYLYLCKKEYGQEGGHCCESCSDQDLSCIDDGSFWGADKKSCAEFVSEDPCRCEDMQVSERCCASCQGKVCAACRDYLSASQWIEIIRPGGPNKRITDCQEVADKYLYLCKKKYGMEGGHCCETCSAIDLDCIDDTSVSWTVNDVQLKCKEYVKKNPARCYNTYVKTTCCKSCEEFCVDTGAKVTVKVKVGTPKQNVKCKNCSCAEIVAKGEEFSTKACRKRNVTKKCCETCSNYK